MLLPREAEDVELIRDRNRPEGLSAAHGERLLQPGAVHAPRLQDHLQLPGAEHREPLVVTCNWPAFAKKLGPFRRPARPQRSAAHRQIRLVARERAIGCAQALFHIDSGLTGPGSNVFWQGPGTDPSRWSSATGFGRALLRRSGEALGMRRVRQLGNHSGRKRKPKVTLQSRNTWPPDVTNQL